MDSFVVVSGKTKAHCCYTEAVYCPLSDACSTMHTVLFGQSLIVYIPPEKMLLFLIYYLFGHLLVNVSQSIVLLVDGGISNTLRMGKYI